MLFLFLAPVNVVERVGVDISGMSRHSERKRTWATEVGSHLASGMFLSNVFQ